MELTEEPGLLSLAVRPEVHCASARCSCGSSASCSNLKRYEHVAKGEPDACSPDLRRQGAFL